MPEMQARSGGLAEAVSSPNSQIPEKNRASQDKIPDTGSVNWSFFDLI